MLLSNTFNELTKDKLNEAITSILCPQIHYILNNRGVGHCMRIMDLEEGIMMAVCQEIRKQQIDVNVHILAGEAIPQEAYFITSTKLVELRNPLPDGSLRPPLLVFIPASLRTSAEDSFGITTFEELSFSGLYHDLITSLLERVPATLVGHVRDIFTFLDEEKWPYSDDLFKARYLLTALKNGIDGETLGASLYELTLIPDFKLFKDTSLVRTNIQKNLECVHQLMNSHKSVLGRILDLSLCDVEVTNYLHSFFEQYEIHEPEIWTKSVVLDKKNWAISFDKWRFKEGLVLDKVNITVCETDLPIVSDDEIGGQLSTLIGQQVLVPNQRQKMNIKFEVDPHPKKVRGLDLFTVQIVSVEAGPVGKSKKVKVWKVERKYSTVSLTKLNTSKFEEGWHYIRILPWTEDGDPIPLVGANNEESSTLHPYESEPFYVLTEGVIEEEPPQRAKPFERSLEHARMKLQFIAINANRDPSEINVNEVTWETGTGRKKADLQETLLVKFGRDGAVQVPISRTLKKIEQQILTKPKHPCGWRMQISMDSPAVTKETIPFLPSSTALQSFFSAREDYFSAIRQDTSELIFQGASLTNIKDLCISYQNHT